MATKIQFRRATSAEWSAANPILADGEMGFERDTKVIKVGDGVTRWNSLAAPSATDTVARSLVNAKGDIIAATADNAVNRLAVGTNGQVLTADSTAPTGLKWGPSGAGSIPSSIIDGKGDLIVGSANDVAGRLAAGTNGFVLTADTAAPDGLKWAKPNASNFVGAYITDGNLYVPTNTFIDRRYAIGTDAKMGIANLVIPYRTSRGATIMFDDTFHQTTLLMADNEFANGFSGQLSIPMDNSNDIRLIGMRIDRDSKELLVQFYNSGNSASTLYRMMWMAF